MAYIDEMSLRTKPQWWTAAVFRQVAGKGLIFQKWLPAQQRTWSDFLDLQMGLYRSIYGYKLAPYYWDGTKWQLDSSGSAVRFQGELVGKLERRNPLPPGRYWQDLFAKNAEAWNTLIVPAIDRGDVKVIKHEHFNEDVLHEANAGEIPERDWFLFEVVRPIDWPAVKLGYPTVADSDVQTSADTSQNPEGPSPVEEVADAIARAAKPATDKVLTPALTVLGLYLGFKAVQALRK